MEGSIDNCGERSNGAHYDMRLHARDHRPTIPDKCGQGPRRFGRNLNLQKVRRGSLLKEGLINHARRLFTEIVIFGVMDDPDDLDILGICGPPGETFPKRVSVLEIISSHGFIDDDHPGGLPCIYVSELPAGEQPNAHRCEVTWTHRLHANIFVFILMRSVSFDINAAIPIGSLT